MKNCEKYNTLEDARQAFYQTYFGPTEEIDVTYAFENWLFEEDEDNKTNYKGKAMLIIEAEIPAGPTIEEAIRECVIFAKNNNVMVRTEINDIPMLILFGSVFGSTIEECTDTFLKEYEYLQREHATQTFGPKTYYEKLLEDPTVKKILEEKTGNRI